MNSSVSRRAPALRALVGISMLALSGVAMKIKQSRGLRMQKFGIVLQAALSLAFFVCVEAHAQGVQPYPNAITTREVRSKTPMLPPPVNIVFTDPDFGSEMVRVTDENMAPSGSRGFFVNPGGLMGAWSADGQKFYVFGESGRGFAFGFDAADMSIKPLPGTAGGEGLSIPLRWPTFSFVDPDLMYGTLPNAPLTIASYRFSTSVITPLVDTTKCGTEPPLASHVYSDVVNVSRDDKRLVAAEGAKEFGSYMFVTVYDKHLGCRWYNTQTGQISGSWGASGQASTGDKYLVNHSEISGSGRYVRIGVEHFGFYVWDVATLNVTACPVHARPDCAGYSAIGHNDLINAPGEIDEMNTLKRPLGDLTRFTQLVHPLPLPHLWGMEVRFSWTNGKLNDYAPVCGTTTSYDGDPSVKQAYDGEIFCIETDESRSTIWRFAHNRAAWDNPYFYTAPLANVSLDGRFLLFTSSWDNQVGTTNTGAPRADVWIVKLD